MEFTHILMKLDNGKWTTIHKDNIDKFKDMGYEFGAEARGAATWHIEEALGLEKYGDSYITKGRYAGRVAMYFPENGGTVAVEEDRIEAHFETGYVMGDAKNIPQ